MILRLLTELLLVGVYTDADILYNILKDTITSDNLRDSTYHTMSLIVSFTRTAGEELLGLQKAREDDSSNNNNRVQLDVELSESDRVLTVQQRDGIVNLLNTYFDFVSQHLVHLQKELRAKERENHHILETKGELR